MAIYNFETASFYAKWHRDMCDALEPNGHLASIIPTSGWGKSRPNGSPGSLADPWWGGAVIMVPWYLYQYYGDTRVFEEGYESMKKYVEYLGTASQDRIVSWSLGDWLEVGSGGTANRTPVPLTSTCGYFHVTHLLSQIAEILGKNDDAQQIRELAEEIKSRFNERFFNAETGLYAEDSQSAQIMPLLFGMVPEGKKEQVFQQLVDNVENVRDGHVSTGIVATGFLMDGLTEFGRSDLAYAAATKEDYPSWLWMINSGGTSLWESWNGHGSLNHPALGCIGSWFYTALAGIRLDPSAPGFKRIIIKPEVVGDLTWAKGTYHSIRGPISSEWHLDGETFTLAVTIPPNTSATIFLPSPI